MAEENKSQTRFQIPGVEAAEPHTSQLIVRKSRFLAQSCHCSAPAEARGFVAAIRAKYPEATHHCWAYLLGPPGSTASICSADDGEPHGTAGKPILQALLHSGTGQICMVVSRWFGGIKLGTGGLVRAYQQSALENLASLPRIENIIWQSWKITVDYAQADELMRILPALEAKMENADYQQQVEFLIRIPLEREGELEAALARTGRGRAVMKRI